MKVFDREARFFLKSGLLSLEDASKKQKIYEGEIMVNSYSRIQA